MDRVVEMTFGVGDACYHLILEFYARVWFLPSTLIQNPFVSLIFRGISLSPTKTTKSLPSFEVIKLVRKRQLLSGTLILEISNSLSYRYFYHLPLSLFPLSFFQPFLLFRCALIIAGIDYGRKDPTSSISSGVERKGSQECSLTKHSYLFSKSLVLSFIYCENKSELIGVLITQLMVTSSSSTRFLSQESIQRPRCRM